MAAFSFDPSALREKIPQSVETRDGQGRLSMAPAADGRYRVWRPLSAMSPLLLDAARAELGPADGRKKILARRLSAILCGEGWPCGLERLWLRASAGESELLEAYLNLAPYGAEISGAEAASFVYFDKHADQLTLSEALTLSVMPERPVRETLLGDNPSDRLSRKKAARRLRERVKDPAYLSRPRMKAAKAA